MYEVYDRQKEIGEPSAPGKGLWEVFGMQSDS